MRVISIAKDFSPTPGARWRVQGFKSGQEFRETLLEPAYKEDPMTPVTVDLDGVAGLPPSFIIGAFLEFADIVGPVEAVRFLRFSGPVILLDCVRKFFVFCDAQS